MLELNVEFGRGTRRVGVSSPWMILPVLDWEADKTMAFGKTSAWGDVPHKVPDLLNLLLGYRRRRG